MATIYIVLREEPATLDREEGVYDETPVLVLLGTADTETPRQAIKAFSEPEDQDPVGGVYVAVPLRNWTEEECEPEVRVRVSYRTRDIIPGGGDRMLTHVGQAPIPGQTTIEAEEEAAKLAQQIGDPEFGPEEEEPFDPSNLGGSGDPPAPVEEPDDDDDQDDDDESPKAA